MSLGKSHTFAGSNRSAMTITFRNYQSPADIGLQEAFWAQATRQLPWCWKPTRSPALYSKGQQFDPRSRCFAFEGGQLVGYASFTGQGDFVSLGYPWVLPGYEGDLQEKLYDSVYGFAASAEYGGKAFAQRFRQHWAAQISFFERHGFVVQRSDPIYALDIGAFPIPHVSSQYRVTCHPTFCWDDFRDLSARTATPQQLSMWQQYFQTVDFDFAVKASTTSLPVAYFGIAVRHDTYFAELIAVALDSTEREAFMPCLLTAIAQARSREARFLGTKTMPLDGTDKSLLEIGFRKVSEELILSKTL
jgi:hypothetical protein